MVKLISIYERKAPINTVILGDEADGESKDAKVYSLD
jgi:hypothetical protein